MTAVQPKPRSVRSVAVAAAAATCASIMSGCSTAHGNQTVAASETVRNSAKPDITQMSESLVVGRGSFPNLPDADWRAPYIYMDYLPNEIKIDPAACAPLAGDVPYKKNSHALASLQGKVKFRVDLILPANGQPPNPLSLMDKCRSMTVDHSHYSLDPVSIDHLPPWALGVRERVVNDEKRYQGADFAIFGGYRGLFIFEATYREPEPTAEDISAAVKLFNDQIAKLEAAPA